jgi:hypothetical protein
MARTPGDEPAPPGELREAFGVRGIPALFSSHCSISCAKREDAAQTLRDFPWPLCRSSAVTSCSPASGISAPAVWINGTI